MNNYCQSNLAIIKNMQNNMQGNVNTFNEYLMV